MRHMKTNISMDKGSKKKNRHTGDSLSVMPVNCSRQVIKFFCKNVELFTIEGNQSQFLEYNEASSPVEIFVNFTIPSYC